MWRSLDTRDGPGDRCHDCEGRKDCGVGERGKCCTQDTILQEEANPVLIIECHEQLTRITLNNKFREDKTVLAHEVNTSFSQQTVYVNENTTFHQVGIKYVWCRDGKSFVRERTAEKFKRIRFCEEVAKIQSN